MALSVVINQHLHQAGGQLEFTIIRRWQPALLSDRCL